MKPNHHHLDLWTLAFAFGLPLLVMLAAVLAWPFAVQFALVAALIVPGLGSRILRSRFVRRR